MNNFVFNKEKHEYLLNGKPLTGVTTVLRVIAKPALIQWAANETVEYIKEHGKEDSRQHPFTWLVDEEILEDARKAHLNKKKDAGDKGKDVHTEIEGMIKVWLLTDGLPCYLYGFKESFPQTKKFVDWAIDKKVKFFSCEEQVYSEKYWIAGTYDFIIEIDGKKFVGDIKTSNAIYGREYFAQCAAYRLMLEEMGQKGFDGSLIIRLGKDGSFEEHYSLDYKTDRTLFLACLEVYRAMGTFENNTHVVEKNNSTSSVGLRKRRYA